MGLLDGLFATPSDQAMWALGSGLLGVRKGNEGRAMMGAMGAYNDAQQEQRRNELVQLQRQMTEFQLANAKRQSQMAEKEDAFYSNPSNLMSRGQSAFPANEMDAEGSPEAPSGMLPPQMIGQRMIQSGVPSLAKTGMGMLGKESRPPVVVSKGGVLVDAATGRPMFTNQEAPEQWEPLPQKSSGGQMLIRNRGTGEIKAVGSGPLVQNVNNAPGAGGPAGRPMSPMDKKFDEKAASDLSDWALGGFADSTKQIATLRSVASRLTSDSGLTGPTVGAQPRQALAVTNPEALQALEQTEEVIQRNLRVILGAQFTEKEGERLISRAYNPWLKPEQNKARLDALIIQMEAAAKAKQDALDYFQAKGTLQGWKGKMPTISDFYEAIDRAGAVGGKVDGGWKVEKAPD